MQNLLLRMRMRPDGSQEDEIVVEEHEDLGERNEEQERNAYDELFADSESERSTDTEEDNDDSGSEE
jgi:hypothetical protein